MSDKIKVVLKPDDEDRAHCHLYLSSYDRAAGREIFHFFDFVNEGPSGSFNFESRVELPSRTYYLQLKVFGTGRKAEATVVGNPTVLSPLGNVWPLAVEVPTTKTTDSGDYAFAHGA